MPSRQLARPPLSTRDTSFATDGFSATFSTRMGGIDADLLHSCNWAPFKKFSNFNLFNRSAHGRRRAEARRRRQPGSARSVTRVLLNVQPASCVARACVRQSTGIQKVTEPKSRKVPNFKTHNNSSRFLSK